jgi:hypothetical protein
MDSKITLIGLDEHFLFNSWHSNKMADTKKMDFYLPKQHLATHRPRFSLSAPSLALATAIPTWR